MFAGPNGSGKSELKKHLHQPLLGIYLNPDEVEQAIRREGFCDFNHYGIRTTSDEVLGFFQASTFLSAAGFAAGVKCLKFVEGRMEFCGVEVNSYFASVAADFIRQKLLENKMTFTCETVMSHPGKITLLEQAQRAGYRTYLYYIATDDPAINISRVKARVRLGGHAVPEDKIEPRYHRSLDLLMTAIRSTNRAYIFDNSGENQAHTWIAEITDGRELELKIAEIPAWFRRAVLEKIGPPGRPGH